MRCDELDLQISETTRARLLAYYALLFHWDRKINLTSLSDNSKAVDRLLVEPLLAARSLAPAGSLVDLGSGGGSPAIPLALALNANSLVMVESRGRKAAFLRHAVAELGLPGGVQSVRFEELAGRPEFKGRADLATLRAVRLDDTAITAAQALVRPGGSVALFLASQTPLVAAIPTTPRRISLLPGTDLVQFVVPRETPD